MKKLILPLIVLSLAATAATAQPRLVETVYGVEAAKSGVKFRVSSNGCTRKEHFVVRTTRSRPAQLTLTLTLTLTTPDRCQSFAMGSTWITIPYEEVGAREFRLANPVTAWTGPGE